MKKIGLGLTVIASLLGACSDSGSSLPPLPSVEWMVPYTVDANIPRHLTSDLELNRAETLLGARDEERSLLKKTPFETTQQFQARGPATLATLSPPVDGRSRFVFSVPAKMMTYDLATTTATFCVFDILLSDCLEKEPGDDDIDLSLGSVALAGRAYSRWTVLRFTNPDLEASPVPVALQLAPDVADRIDNAGQSRMAFVGSFGPPFRDSGPVVVANRVTRPETFTTTAIEARLERIVIYQPNGDLVGAVAVP